MLFPVVLVAIVALGAGGVFLQRRQGQSAARPPEGVEAFEISERGHVDGPVDYPQSPPVGGPHAPVPQTCGVYEQPIRPENALHSREHGAVWITYRPGLSRTDIAKVERLASIGHVLVSPYPGLPTAVVASAWARQLRVGSPDDPRLERFVRAFRFGGQSPEPGAPCQGLGAPS